MKNALVPGLRTAAFLRLVAGHDWTASRLTDAHGGLAVPKKYEAGIGFTRNGWLLAGDGVNAIDARYMRVDGGYVIRTSTVMSTMVGLSSDAPKTLIRTRIAVNAMADPERGTAVRGSVYAHGSRLVLRNSASGVTLTLRRAGREPNFHE